MSSKSAILAVVLVTSELSFAGWARADWLAAEPGTKISIQVNDNGSFVVRPIGGTWAHPLCADVTAALLPAKPTPSPHLVDTLIAAAVNGSFVNVFAEAEECSANGYPIIRNVRIQGP